MSYSNVSTCIFIQTMLGERKREIDGLFGERVVGLGGERRERKRERAEKREFN